MSKSLKKVIRLHHACIDIGNVGDAVSKYIAEKVTPQKVEVVTDLSEPHYFITGSILTDANEHTTVLGAGLMSIDQEVDDRAEIVFVRGPLSADKVGGEFICDPACTLPYLYTPAYTEVVYDLGVVPHYVDLDIVTTEDGVHTIPPLLPVEEFVDELSKCKCIMSSSLHGIIIAHAYGIPALWVKISDGLAGDGTKFEDYFLSVDIKPYDPVELTHISKDLIYKVSGYMGKGRHYGLQALDTITEYLNR